MQRRDNGRWEAPGGVLELDETFEAGVRREVVEETGVLVEVLGLTGVYKNLVRGVVALANRRWPVGGQTTTTDEAQDVQWLTAELVRERLLPAYAVRVLDALDSAGGGTVASRAHDGFQLR